MSMFLNKAKILFVLLVICLLTFPTNGAFAQLPSAETLTLSMSPENPRPAQTISFELESFSFDLSSATVSWFVNGRLQKKEIGATTFNTAAPSLGATATISAIVKTISGNSFERSRSVRPASVELVWEAETFTPPFYRGKALFSHQSTVRVVAVPHLKPSSGGPELDPRKLSYTWRKNGTVLGSDSGYGKQVLRVTGPTIIKPVELSVTVASIDGGMAASSAVALESIRPMVLLYETDPFLGIRYDRTIGTLISEAPKEITLLAAPFFFSKTDREAGKVSIRWLANGSEVASGSEESVTFRKESGQGEAVVSVSVENKSRIYQFGRANTAITIGDSSR
jgi:hypothetical protein